MQQKPFSPPQQGPTRHDRLGVIIGTAERDKAEAGLMEAANCPEHGWMEDGQLFLFGPAGLHDR